MSEKSFTMDTVYSGMIMDGDLPSEPLEVHPLPQSFRVFAPQGPVSIAATGFQMMMMMADSKTVNMLC